jgi:hypothetical protein
MTQAGAFDLRHDLNRISADWAVERDRRMELEEALERLITAVEWEVPPIRDGVEVERRLDILARHAVEAEVVLRQSQGEA